MTEEQISQFMSVAIAEARQGADEEEIPIGCVVVRNGEIIARAHNTKEQNKNSLNHAEINAMKAATLVTNEKYLTGCSVFVTLEPCAMCTGAMINYRIGELYFGAWEPKSGCCGSLYDLPSDARFNHRFPVYGGVMEPECAEIMKTFFAERRKKC